ncbi:MAG: FecR domain-containing protein [Chitinispirillaceae bacterium]|nr:FecR domain-containing protein [Chitinispirillaceae bacterium]
MKRMILLCIGISLLNGFAAAAEEARARITQVGGTVEVRAKGVAVWRMARLGMPVKEGWDVRAYVEAEAEVTFENGTKLIIGENSIVTLSRLKSDVKASTSQSTVKVLTGKVWANVKKLTSTQSEFEFETPTAVASIRGTRLGIDVVKRRTVIDVYDGVVAVRRRGETASINATANSRVIIDRDERELQVIDFKEIRGAQGQQGGGVPRDPFADEEGAPSDGSTPSPADSTGIPFGSDTVVTDTAGQQGSAAEPEGARRLILSVSAPAEGARITEPLIQVTGNTLPDAKVFVNDMQAAVGRDGAFSYRFPVPDEPNTYTIEIRAEYGGSERVLQRNVAYDPPTDKELLECFSPLDGQLIKTRTIRVSGKTAKGAAVTANGVPVSVAANGIFNGELVVSERDIGDYQLEIIARSQGEELARSFNLKIDGTSPQINTSVPLCLFSLQGQQATMQRTVPLQVLDRTPGEELTIKIINNGSAERITSEPGRTEQLLLNEGANDYSIQVVDRAGNSSPVIRGRLYYLPGPLIILLHEPSSNPMIYEGLPPVLHPGNRGAEESIDVEVEIDDGIGNVPQSIHYCRVTGNGQTIQLRNNNDYMYVGKVNVRRGSNQFTIQVEDLSGRLETLRFEVILR